MRVTCEKCKAVYAVDDKLIPPKGARAQCPKCKALQIVKRDGSAVAVPAPAPVASAPQRPAPAPGVAPAAPPSAPAPTPASAFDDLLGMVSATPPKAPPASADPFASLSLGPAPGVAVGDPFGAPRSPAAAAPDPFANLDLGPKPEAADPFSALDLGPATAGPSPFAPPRPQAPAPDPFSSPAPAKANPFAPAAPAAPAPSTNFDDLFGSTLPSSGPAAPLAVPPPGVSAGPVVPCRSCRKPLPDPFDAALGICEACRAKEQKPTQPVAAPKPQVVVGGAAASAPAPLDPFGDAGGGLELDLSDRGGGAAAPPIRPPSNPAASAAAAAAAAASAAKARPQRPVVTRPVSRGGTSRYLVAVLVLALLGGGAYVWFTKPAFLFKKVVANPVLPAVDKRLMDWKLGAMGLEGSAAEHFSKGRKAFLSDKPTSYLEAEEEFKAAVVLEPTDLKSVAFYVEAFAVGRGERAPEAVINENRELIQAVIDAQPTASIPRRAKASLLLIAGHQDLARSEAEEAVRLAAPEERAEALLTLGTVYLRKSAPIAQEKIDAALKLDKSLRRAWYYRGLANEHGGRYATALADFGERLKLDPDQREALRAQARVYAKLGDYQAARKALAHFASKHPNVGEPRVLLVQLAYAVERDLREAEKTLRELKASEDRFDDSDKLQLHSLWAAVARERGDTKSANAHVDEALKIDPNWAPAHFQRMLLALAANDHQKARTELDACEAKMDDPIRAKEYLGRIEVAAGNPDKALIAFREAQDSAPGRISPRLNSAAILANKGELDQAWAVMRRALDCDPTSVSRQRRQVSDYFEAPVDGIRAVPKAFDAINDEGNWLVQVYSAVAAYHVGDFDRAERGLDRSLATDPSSLAALLYRAQLEIDRKRYDRAQVFAKRAIEVERQSAVAFYLLARVEEGMKKPEQARTTLLQAVQRDPGLAPANAWLGILSREDDKEGAKKWLLQALASDPDNSDARLALFKLGY